MSLFYRTLTEVMSFLKMLAILTYFFLFSLCLQVIKTSEIFKTGKQVAFNDFFKLFQNCTLNFYNYEDKSFYISSTPVIIQTNNTFEVTQLMRYPSKTPYEYHCLAIVHILPNGTLRNDRYNEKPFPLLNTERRYEIIIEDTTTPLDKLWKSAYYPIFTKHDSTIRLILELPVSLKSLTTTPLSFINKLGIVNQYRISLRKRVTKTVDLNHVVKRSKRKYLDQIVMDVQSLSNNPDVEWSIGFASRLRRSMNGKRILDSMKMNIFLMGYPNILIPRKVSEEGIQNFLFAFTALGTAINVTEFSNPPKLSESMKTQPRITFDVEYGPIMMDKDSKQFGLLSCSKTRTYIFKRYTFQEAIIDLLSIFQKQVYLAIFLSYGVPAFVLGVIYHGILKKHLKEVGWIKWHPFTWGIRALIWQAGDRTLNSLRFGWTIFMVTPWLLMAVVLSYTFRGNILSVVSMYGKIMHTFTSLGEMYESNFSLITDNTVLALKRERFMGFENYADIAYMIHTNDSVTYLSNYDRIAGVASMMRYNCENRRVPLKVRKVYSWELYFFDWKVRYNLRSGRLGWSIQNVFDHRIFTKLSRLEFDSGIVGKWNEVIERATKYRGRSNLNTGGYAKSICLMSNILYVFYFGASCLGGTLVIWLLECLLILAFPRPQGKKPLKLNVSQKPINPDTEQDVDNPEAATNEPNCNDESDIINEAIALVDEKRRLSIPCKPSVQVGGIGLRSHSIAEMGNVRPAMCSKAWNVQNKSTTSSPNIDDKIDEIIQEGDSDELDSLELVVNPQNMIYEPRDKWDDINDILGDTVETHGSLQSNSEQRLDT